MYHALRTTYSLKRVRRFFASLCINITRQQIELDSCSNHNDAESLKLRLKSWKLLDFDFFWVTS